MIAADEATALAEKWRDRLTDDDTLALAKAFHRAESLAHAALEDAIEQVSESYRTELEEQLEDESRHVSVFARWLGPDVDDFRVPRSRQRTEPVWFAMLLVNEVAGFCQFHMLEGLVDDPSRAAEVAAVANDEVGHITRLVKWLLPHYGTKSQAQIDHLTGAFRNRLEGRMHQFLPREQLAELRREMAAIINRLLVDLLPAEQPSSSVSS